MKHVTNIVSALADGVNEPTSMNPVLIFSELDAVSAVFTDRNRGPTSSLFYLLPQIRLLLLSLLLDDESQLQNNNFLDLLLAGLFELICLSLSSIDVLGESLSTSVIGGEHFASVIDVTIAPR